MAAQDGFIEIVDQPGIIHSIPKSGIGIFLTRSASAFNNSTVQIIRYEGGVRTILTEKSIAFQFEFGVMYKVVFTITQDFSITVQVSNGINIDQVSSSSTSVAFPLNQFFITDTQGGISSNTLGMGTFLLSFDEFLITQQVGCNQVSADAGPERTVKSGELLRFDGSGSSCLAAIVSFDWNFGDGQSAQGLRSSHRFSRPGVYDVTLTIRDESGQSASDTARITVSPLTTTAIFSHRDNLLILHSASVTATYYWDADFANGPAYQLTNISYEAAGVVYSDVFVVSSANNIVPLPVVGCFVFPTGVIFYQPSVRSNNSWNPNLLVRGENVLLVRAFWAPTSVGHGRPPIPRFRYNCAFNFFLP